MSTIASSEPGEFYETQHVHTVYDQIASHFSSTRYKPWPIVKSFLSNVHPGSIGIDAGCGNGKYLSVNRDVLVLGSDRSTPLVRIAKENHVPCSVSRSNELDERHNANKGSVGQSSIEIRSRSRNRPDNEQKTGHAEVLVADGLSLPHPKNAFDFALSIAVVHHFSTKERRVSGIREVLEVLRPPSQSFSSLTHYKPAPEVKKVVSNGGRALIFVWALEQKDSRRGWDVGHEQDVMVPWVTNKTQNEGHDGKIRGSETDDAPAPRTFYRYYHLYRQGELEEDIVAAGGRVRDSGYERDNWWAVAVRA